MRDKSGKYLQTTRLGAGGMGQVWSAIKQGDDGLRMPCAIKVLHPALAMTTEDRERFFGEARIAAQLDHGRIVKVLDTSEVQGSPCLIMEWVDGVNLRHHVVGSVTATCSAQRRDGYERHQPEQTLLYQVVADHWPSFSERAEQAGGLPKFVVDEFEAYLRCGILEHGVAHLACSRCGHSLVVAYSCKRRGFCPSCLGRVLLLEVDLLVRAVERSPVSPATVRPCAYSRAARISPTMYSEVSTPS